MMCVLAACGDRPVDELDPVDQLTQIHPLIQEVVSELSAEFSSRIGDGIGHTIEGRFVGNGAYVVLLDRYSPHLRLFTADGTPLWAGGETGGGPREFRNPWVVSTKDDRVIVLQRGRLSIWQLQADTLAFVETRPVPPQYAPLGMVPGCDEDWLLFARDGSQFEAHDDVFQGVQAARVDFLHRLRITEDQVIVEPIWTDGLADVGTVEGHAATMIDRLGNRVVIIHRPHYLVPDRIVELDCAGTLLHIHDEEGLARGDPYPVLLPRPRGTQWTAGIIAVTDGQITAKHRPFAPHIHGVDEPHNHTETFRFERGEYRGSVVLPGQWLLLDHHPEGGVLLARNHPVAEFIRIPEPLLAAHTLKGTGR